MLLATQPIKIMTKVVFLKKIVWKYFKMIYLFLKFIFDIHVSKRFKKKLI
jgi:hypothetical protein